MGTAVASQMRFICSPTFTVIRSVASEPSIRVRSKKLKNGNNMFFGVLNKDKVRNVHLGCFMNIFSVLKHAYKPNISKKTI